MTFADGELEPPEPVGNRCSTCDGTGEAVDMACYGGAPVEVNVKCPDCDGQGYIILDLDDLI